LIFQIPIGGGKILIGEPFWESIQIIPLVMLAYVFYAAYVLQMPSLYDSKNQRWSPFLRGLGAFINVVLNIILIPIYGIFGAAIATLLAYFIMFLALYLLNRVWLPISFNYIKIFLLLLICILGFYYLGNFEIQTNKLFERVFLSVIILIVAVGEIGKNQDFKI